MKESYKLQQLKNQFMIAVPNAVARAKGWKKGQKLKGIINSKGNLKLKEGFN